MTIMPHIFEAYLKCATKCWLMAAGEYATGNAYAEWLKTQSESYRAAGAKRLLMETPDGACVISPSPEQLNTAKWRMALSVATSALTPCVVKGEQRADQVSQKYWPANLDSVRPPEASIADTSLQLELETPQNTRIMPAPVTTLHAVERVSPKGRGNPTEFVPIRFVYTNKVDKSDRLMLAFDAMALSGLLGHEVTGGKIIYGDDYNTVKVKTADLTDEVRKGITNIAALLASSAPPDLALNAHCAECEFQARCRRIAAEKDDLSLMSSVSAKERKALHSKGIFTVTQLSYVFRPRRRPKILRDKRERYHHSLKALAIREKKIHIVGSPVMNFDGTPVYLDVEGLPDREFYYLIGVRIGEGQCAVQHSLWADTIEDEGKIWNEFLGILATVEKPILLHYGSYDATFLTQMQKRHGIPPGTNVSTAKALEQPRNLLSLIFATVYFPTFSNGLKDIAGWLGFNWSEPDASGVASVVWRHRWEESQSDEFKQKLIIYKAE